MAYVLVMAAAFVAVAPFLRMGNASGHDFEFHVYSWLEVVNQWKQGILYPRWAEWAHYAYGEARFVFYPPASWTLGAFLGSFLPWKVAPGAYIWVVLTLSGCSMLALARRWMGRNDAIWAAVLYTVNPYYIVVIYWRSAYAELLAGALIPLLLLYVLRLEEERWKVAVPLALIVAAAWLTNAPSAVMVNYSLVLLIVVMAVVRRSSRSLLPGLISVGLGLLLAAFYVVPAIYEQKWVDISQVLGPGVRPQDNFLFTVLNDDLHNRFNQLISFVAVSEIATFVVAAPFLWKARREEFWWPQIVWGLAACLLMISPALFFWQHLPKLRFMQLPWRWLLCLNVPMVFLMVRAWKHWAARTAIYLAMLLVIGFCWQRVQEPWWDTDLDMAEMHRNLYEKVGYEGTDEYVPLGSDSYEIKQDARRVTMEGPGTAQIRVTHWDAESKSFVATVSAPGKLVLRLFNYPAWKVQVNGAAVAAETHTVTGQMSIPVLAGENQVEVKFSRTWDRTVGGLVSMLSVLGTFIFWRRVRV
ncbi:MAG TPA: 6-pyruvoyl-tetrahydropterin synthase-related protein [Terriglobales bacterium]|nr:6-pyruvoyl-tetrahydropterin synthase-related protein [Terriglobales bacterium]